MSKVPLSSAISAASAQAPAAATPTPDTTGRFIVTFREGAEHEAAAALSGSGLQVASSKDFTDSAVDFGALTTADALVLPEIGVAVVSSEPERMDAMSALGETSPILAIEPERYVYALAAPAPIRVEEPAPEQPAAPGLELPPAAAAYIRGYADAVDGLTRTLLASASAAAAAQPVVQAWNESQITWGLQATRVPASAFSGKAIKVAVLDTGFDLTHPDFVGRSITAVSFVPGQTAQDGHGHGTHTAGTACGPKAPAIKPRYGVAYEALMYIGKVLNNSGSGTDGWILAGINWAVANGCPVISMSLGRAVAPGEPPPVAYETAARNALTRGCLIIAAAGNESDRANGIFRPVGAPANCPSIMAVGAVDENFRIANFSDRAINVNGGEVNIVGPGVNVYSSFPMPTRYRRLSGTSMATPHVSGIAALYAQSSPTLRGAALWLRLQATARMLTIPVVDEGRGLVQAS